MAKPVEKDLSLKHRKAWPYLKILNAVYALRREKGAYHVGWDDIATKTGLASQAVSRSAHDLEENGFFRGVDLNSDLYLAEQRNVGARAREPELRFRIRAGLKQQSEE